MQVELEQLLILQDRAQKIRQVEAELRNLPLERRSLDEQSAAASAKFEALKDRGRHVEMERKKLELEVGTRNDSIARLRTQQFETRKNDEFSAMGREIERYQQEITKLEDQELELMEQGDQLKAQVGACNTTSAISATGMLSGDFTWLCERGRVRGSVLLAPTTTPQIQSLTLTRANP